MDSFASNYQTIKNRTRNNIDEVYSKLIGINFNLLKKYVKIFSHFNGATLELSSNSTPTVQKVIPLGYFLEKECQAKIYDEDQIKSFKSKFIKKLKSYMKIFEIHKISLLLNPTKRT